MCPSFLTTIAAILEDDFKPLGRRVARIESKVDDIDGCLLRLESTVSRMSRDGTRLSREVAALTAAVNRLAR